MAKDCLEVHEDNIEKAVEFLGKFPPLEIYSAIHAKKLEQDRMKRKRHSFGRRGRNSTSLSGGVPTVSNSQDAKKQICLKVIKVEDGAKITVQAILDRNRLPLQQPSKIYHIGVKELSEMDFEFADKKLVQTLVKIRKLKLVYQVEEDAFIPIGVEPKDVPFREYEPDYDQYSKKINRVTHRIDGQIMFDAVLDTNKGLVDHEQPLLIYTQVIDEQTHNVLLLCLNHYTKDLSLDFLNLTNTSRTAADCHEFNPDASGRKHSYRIIVKEGKVVAILTPFGDEVKELPFVERTIPAVGSLVALDGGDLALVKAIPTGLIISNSDEEVEIVRRRFEKMKPCNRRHTEELDGFVDCEVIYRGEWLEVSREEAHNLVYMFPPSGEQQRRYLQHLENIKEDVKEVEDPKDILTSWLDDCETLLTALPLSADKKAAFQEIQRLWTSVNQLIKEKASLVDVEKKRRNDISRNIQCIALDMRTVSRRGNII